MGRRIRQIVLAILALSIMAYGGAVIRLMMQETELIFRTGAARADTRPPFPYTQIDLPRPDGARQFAWRVERAVDGTNGHGDADWVLYLHGNASTVASRMNVKHYGRLRELGLNVLAPEYRGYNGLAGVPSESSVLEDARAGYDYLRRVEGVPPSRLMIYGWSLGGAIAVTLAASVDARGVVLEGTPASIVDIGAARYPMFPVRWIIRNPFNAIEKVRAIRAPLLFLHSPEDTVVPFAEGRRLFDAATAPKTFVEVHGGHVESSEIDGDKFYGAVRSFLQATATPPLSH
jgi:fermentation-respiration switch protein FrsA (DUF1100 family)